MADPSMVLTWEGGEVLSSDVDGEGEILRIRVPLQPAAWRPGTRVTVRLELDVEATRGAQGG